MARIVVGKRGQVTIPREVREQMGIAPGEVLAVEEAGDGCLRIERWDPEHPIGDWEYHARFAPRARRGAVYGSLQELEAALMRDSVDAAADASAAGG
jgi:AbrB family looped-hinge helix DNA binding protein